MNRYKLSKAGIDVNDGIKRFNNNKEMYEEFLNEFITDKNYQNMLDAIEKGDVKEAFLSAHSLKGIVGNLSFKDFHKSIIPVVEVLRNGSFENIEELLKPVDENYHKVINALKE